MDHCRNSLGTTKLQNPMNMISLLLVVAQVDLHVLRYDVKMALKEQVVCKTSSEVNLCINYVGIKQSIF